MNDRTSMPDPTTRRLVLGDHVLDLVEGELRTADGRLAGLRRRSLELLLELGARSGQVVSRDDLLRQVWPGLVVGDDSITQAVADIRRVLGDAEHRLLQTVARRGYALVPGGPSVPPPGAAPEATAAAAAAVAAAEAALPPVAGIPRRSRWIAAGTLLALLLGAAIWLSMRPVAPSAAGSPVSLPLPASTPALSIVVLPLQKESGARDSVWFADVLHGDLITEVSQVLDSVVIARDTAFTYRDRDVDPRQVARELGVRYVVRGTLRRDAERVRMSLFLIDGESGAQRWSERYDFDRAVLPQVLDDLAVTIGRLLQGALYRSGAERRAALSVSEASADDLSMRAIALWFRGVNQENIQEAMGYAERAVALDPDSFRGWAALAFMGVQSLMNGWATDRETIQRRTVEAGRQLERLDSEAHNTYQSRVIQAFLAKDWPAMVRLAEAWAARHRHPTAFGALGGALTLNGRHDEAPAQLEQALRLSPLDPFRGEWLYRLSLAHFVGGRYEQARDWGRKAEATNPRLPWPPVHAAALLRLGERAEAKETLNRVLSRHAELTLAKIEQRLPSQQPTFAEGRDRLTASLRELGLR
ncbi:MAG: winged helix-turn-helix domain-containing tetratricopeptide repeat protein [Lautropia sp.]